MGGGIGGRANSVIDVESDVCWSYETSGINDCGKSDEREGKLPKEASLQIDEA